MRKMNLGLFFISIIVNQYILSGFFNFQECSFNFFNELSMLQDTHERLKNYLGL